MTEEQKTERLLMEVEFLFAQVEREIKRDEEEQARISSDHSAEA